MKQPKRNSQSRLTSQLEQETNQMEERIVGLKQMLQTMKTKDRNIQSSGGTRWQQATTQKPLKNYAKQTLEQQKRIFPIKKQQNQRNTSAQKNQPSQSKNVENSMDKSLTNFLSLSNVQQNKAASNLNRALILQKEQQNDVVQFLIQNQLSQYASTFIDNGFDDFEILKEIQIQHLDDMKIPPQDGKKIINLLRTPQIVEKQVEKQFEKQVEKQVQKSIQNQKIQTPKSVEVEYNEEESHKYFLEALLDFRNQKPQQEIQIQLKKNEFYGPISSKRQKQQKQRMSFLLQGESTWHQQEDYEQVQQTEEPKQIVKNKGSCYSCYKLIDTDYGFKADNKAFCSKNCLLTYNSSQIYLCKSQSCQKQLNKDVAYYEIGRFFCNQECYNQFIWEQKNTDIKNISL